MHIQTKTKKIYTAILEEMNKIDPRGEYKLDLHIDGDILKPGFNPRDAVKTAYIEALKKKIESLGKDLHCVEDCACDNAKRNSAVQSELFKTQSVLKDSKQLITAYLGAMKVSGEKILMLEGNVRDLLFANAELANAKKVRTELIGTALFTIAVLEAGLMFALLN